MSLRPHTYTVTSSPPIYAQSQLAHGRRTSSPLSIHANPNPNPKSNSPESRHQAQLAAYRRDPTRAASATRVVTLKDFNRSASSGRRVINHSVLEIGYDEDPKKSRRRRRSSLTRLLGWTGSGYIKRLRYLLYAIGLISFLAMVRQLFVPHSIDPYSAQLVYGNSTIPSHLASARAARRRRGSNSATQPRAPLPPALYSKRSTSSNLEHKVSKDGLLSVNPQSNIHPIYQLIRDARKEWDEKVARQSKTLKQAVEEYKKRYRRNPPKGFDKWWDYVCDNDIPLPDEYDQIHKDLLPFRALSPKDLNDRIQSASKLADTYVLRVKRGSIRTNAMFNSEVIHGADERLEQQAELLRPVAKWLPDLEVVWSVHDTPRSIIGWDHRRELLERVEEDEWLNPHDEIDRTLRGWSATCPPRSPIKDFDDFSPPPISSLSSLPDTTFKHKTFISSHSKSMDICQHPELIPIHGSLAGKEPIVEPLTPIFTLSKTRLHSDVLGVPVEQWVDSIKDIPWTHKKEDRLLWRGSNTGIYHSADTFWRDSHRTRLLKMTNHVAIASEDHDNRSSNDRVQAESEDGSDGGIGEEDEEPTEEVHVLPPPRSIKASKLGDITAKIALGELNIRLMDLAFTDVPIQCEIDDGTCEDLSQEYVWTEQMTHEDALEYKYVVDVDGNAWSARFKRLLASGSLIFKATIMPEWWTDRIQPWVHYVPIQMDYSDLYDTLIFFQGDLYRAYGEPALAADIASAGKEWSATHWRKEDMVAYMFRLYLEWGRLMAPRRSSMDFVYKEEMERTREVD